MWTKPHVVKIVFIVIIGCHTFPNIKGRFFDRPHRGGRS